jgi:hypothetical protein
LNEAARPLGRAAMLALAQALVLKLLQGQAVAQRA